MSPAEMVKITVAKAFGLPGLRDSVKASGYSTPNRDVPEADEDYCFSPATLRRLLVWWGNRNRCGGRDGLAIAGPTGSGKSSVAEQFCARLNVPVFKVICSPETEIEDIYGQKGLVGGNTILEKGPGTKAAECGGVLLLEEADRLRATVMGAIAPMMESGPFRIPGDGRLVDPQPLFAVVATMNTRGGNDESGLYVGARQQNLATMSRFQGMSLDYLPPAEEEKILERKVIQKVPTEKGQKEARIKLQTHIEIANKVRKGHLDQVQRLDTTISTRILLRWAELSLIYTKINEDSETSVIRFPYHEALDQALLNMAPVATQCAVHDILDAALGVSRT